MAPFRRFVALYFLVTKALALDMVVDTATMICDNRMVKASLSYVCNSDHVCTFGQQQFIKGSLVYDGIVDRYNATNTEYFFIDGSISLELGGVKAFEHKLVNMARVSICNSFSANEYNMYGDCPADGRYSFDTSYRLRAPESGFMQWAISGYAGEVVLDIYLRNDLVGRCVMEAKTLVSGSYNSRTATPSGKVGAIVALTTMGIFIAYIIFLIIRACRTKRKMQQKRIRKEDEASMSYSRMESCEVPNHLKQSVKDVVIDPRYISSGPVI